MQEKEATGTHTPVPPLADLPPTNGGHLGDKEGHSFWELLGEWVQEASVLLAVFAWLDSALREAGQGAKPTGGILGFLNLGAGKLVMSFWWVAVALFAIAVALRMRGISRWSRFVVTVLAALWLAFGYYKGYVS